MKIQRNFTEFKSIKIAALNFSSDSMFVNDLINLLGS